MASDQYEYLIEFELREKIITGPCTTFSPGTTLLAPVRHFLPRYGIRSPVWHILAP